jgi:hypothetical protein
MKELEKSDERKCFMESTKGNRKEKKNIPTHDDEIEMGSSFFYYSE